MPILLAVCLVVCALALVTIPFLSCNRRAERPNFVLVVVDALRPDFLGCYGCRMPTSPNIDQLAAGGVVFESAVSHAPWTKSAFSSMLTALYPFQHGVVNWEAAMPDTIMTLPEILSSQGYNTMAVVNMLGLTGESKVMKGIAEISEGHKHDRDAPATTEAAIELIKASSKPFFIIIHYFDTHWPYRPPQEYVDMISGAGAPDSTDPACALRLRYGGCVRFVDQSIGRLVAFLDGAGMRNDTVLLITADHGEGLMAHGAGSHGTNLYDEAIRVPLIITYPARYGKGLRIADQVRHIDLLPTIVDLAGARDGQRREGTSLDPLIRKGSRSADLPVGKGKGSLLPVDCALCEIGLRDVPEAKCIRTNDWKLIIEPSTAAIQLYDLTQDRGELTNLWGSGPTAGDTLLRVIGRVPGVSVKGWRIGFTGSMRTGGIRADVQVGSEGRIRLAEPVAGSNLLSFRLSEDSTAMEVIAGPQGLQIMLFEVEPSDRPVTFKFTADGQDAPQAVSVGETGERPFGQAFVLTLDDAMGLPRAFGQSRSSTASGVSLWWLPGEHLQRAQKAVILSPEEQNRLRSLGYIH
ncbi:MAG: sulfatase [Candidatus Eisenbacteria bacterium]